MTTDVFTVTFWRDAAWLDLMCYSYRKHATGFREHVVLIPKRDEAVCRPIVEKHGSKPFIVDETGDGNLFQCAAKCHAMRYTDADSILFVDSDCYFNGPATPESFMLNGKPLLLYTAYEQVNKGLKPGDNFVPWQEGTERAMCKNVFNEYMRRIGQLHHSWLLTRAMETLESAHGKTAWDYIMQCFSSTNGAPGFSEFNYLGAFAHRYHPEAYACIDTTIGPVPDTPVDQAWSHKPPQESHKRAAIEAALGINLDEYFK